MTKAREIASTPETIIASGNFTTVSSLSISNALSDTYRFYNLYFYARSTTSVDLFMRLRNDSTDSTTGYYAGGNYGNYLGGVGAAAARNNGSQFLIGTAGNGFDTITYARITRVSPTLGYYHMHMFDDVNVWNVTAAGRCTSVTNFNGITIYPNTSTITGTYILTGINA